MVYILLLILVNLDSWITTVRAQEDHRQAGVAIRALHRKLFPRVNAHMVQSR